MVSSNKALLYAEQDGIGRALTLNRQFLVGAVIGSFFLSSVFN
jgi:hypothetical protein